MSMDFTVQTGSAERDAAIAQTNRKSSAAIILVLISYVFGKTANAIESDWHSYLKTMTQ